MITFDWSSTASVDQLRRTLDVIKIVGQIDRALDTEVESFAPPGTELHRLSMEFKNAPINLSHSLRASLTAARGALDQIEALIHAEDSTYRIALLALTRTALVGAGRVVYVLGPSDAATRTSNARTVLRQEGSSLSRVIRSSVKFRELAGLIPSAEFVEDIQVRNAEIQEGGGRHDDTLVLSEMAKVIGETLLAGHKDVQESDVAVLAEHVMWVWQTYSGEVHGLGWPALMPGDFVADLGMVVGVAHLAFDTATQATRIQ